MNVPSGVASSVPLLDIQRLSVDFVTRKGNVRTIVVISLAVCKGDTPGLTDRSGSGKSVTHYAVRTSLDRA